MWDLSSPTRDPRDPACTSCIGRWSLNPWTTREVPEAVTLITGTHLDFTHIVSFREWSGFICTAWKSLRVWVSRMWTWWGMVVRFGLGSFTQLFSSKPSLCWVTTFKPYLGQPHTFPVFLACAHRPPLIFPGPVMTGTQGTVTLCSGWALLWQRFHTVSHPIPELPLSLTSYWLIASGWIPESEPPQSIDLGGTLPECSQKAGDNGRANSDDQLDLFSPHCRQCWGPDHLHAGLWTLIRNCVFWCLYCIILDFFLYIKRLVSNRKRSMSRLYIVTLLV